MNKFGILTGALFKNSFATNKKTGRQTNGIVSLIIISLLFGVLTTGGSIAYYLLLKDQFPKHAVLVVCFVVMSIITVLFCFFQMNVTLFKSPDYDMLASYPLKNKTIIMAKLASLYLTNLILDVCSLLPPLVVYLCFGGTFAGFLVGIVGIIFTSIIPLLLVTLIAAIIALLTAKSRHGDMISMILYVLFFVAFACAMALVPLVSNANIWTNAPKILPYYIFLDEAFNGQYLSLLWFVLINVAAIIVIIFFVSLVYTPLNQIHRKNNIAIYKASGDSRVVNIDRVLFKKEMDLVLHNPTFLLSSYIGPVLALVIGLLTFGIIGQGFFTHDEKSVAYAISSLTGMNILVYMLIASLCTTTYASFSMEGKNYTLLFAYPIFKEKIIQAKIKAGIIPLVILFAICAAIHVLVVGICQGLQNITYTMWINAILLPVLSSVIASLVGAIFGMKYIRTDFTDPNDVLKKSKAMYLTLLVSAIINIIGFVGYILLLNLISPNREPLSSLIVTGILLVYYAIIITILSIYLHKKGEILFNKGLEK